MNKDLTKFYPNANSWMWNYCISLGKFTDSQGRNYDLGIHIHNECISAAIVDGNEIGSYYSGDLEYRKLSRLSPYDEKYIMTIKRAVRAGYKIKHYLLT